MLKAIGGWFSEVFLGIWTAFVGMGVTFKHLFRKPVTVEYPDVNVEATLPERYRGILQVDMDICIGCRNCEIDCPIDCIAIEDVKGEKTTVTSRTTGKLTTKLRYPLRFDIDIAKCMFCGLCTENCPTGAIHHTRRFEGCVTVVANLNYSYIRPTDLELARVQEARAKEKKEAAPS